MDRLCRSASVRPHPLLVVIKLDLFAVCAVCVFWSILNGLSDYNNPLEILQWLTVSSRPSKMFGDRFLMSKILVFY